MKKRKLEVVVISDVHLGTYGCHADELIASITKDIVPQKKKKKGSTIRSALL